MKWKGENMENTKLKYTDKKDICTWLVIAEAQAKNLKDEIAKLKEDGEHSKSNEITARKEHLLILTGMQLGFKMILENEAGDDLDE